MGKNVTINRGNLIDILRYVSKDVLHVCGTRNTMGCFCTMRRDLFRFQVYSHASKKRGG